MSVSDAQFAQFIDRIMACRDAEDAAKEDTKAVYGEAHDAGLDKAVLGVVVRGLRMDAKARGKAEMRDALVEDYLDRYRRGKASHVRVRVSGEQIDAETGEITEPQPSLMAGMAAASIPPEVAAPTDPVANVEEEANGAIAVASDDPASRDADDADRQRLAASGFTGEDDGRDVEATGGAAPVITNQPETAERGAGPETAPASDGGAVPPMASSSTDHHSSDLHDGRLQAVPAPALDESRDSAAGVEAPAAPVNPRCLKHQRGEDCKFSHKRYSCAGCNQAAELQRAGAA